MEGDNTRVAKDSHVGRAGEADCKLCRLARRSKISAGLSNSTYEGTDAWPSCPGRQPRARFGERPMLLFSLCIRAGKTNQHAADAAIGLAAQTT